MVTATKSRAPVIDLSEIYRPHPQQVKAHTAPEQNVLYGGAVGGGKTYWLAAEGIQLSLDYPGNRGYLCRQKLTDFRISTLLELKRYLQATVVIEDRGKKEVVGLIEQHHQTENYFRLYNGSVIYYGGIGDDREGTTRVKNMTLGWFGVDQVEEVEEVNFNWLCSRLRLILPGIHYKAILTANPAPGWVKRRFIESKIENHLFIPALPKDNPFLPDDYESNLRKWFPAEMVKALLDGDWDALEGGNFLFRYSEIKSAINKEVTEGDLWAGVDISREGDDTSVFTVRAGERVIYSDSWGKTDLMETTGLILQKIERFNIDPKNVNLDAVALGCFDDKTEILTEQGFKRFDSLNGERVLTMNPDTRESFYVQPSRYFKYQYNGLMYQWDKMTTSFCITPNHSLFYRGVNSKQWQFKNIEDIGINEIHIPRGFKWSGQKLSYYWIPPIYKPQPNGGNQQYKEYNIPIKLWLRYMAWVLSEGFTYELNKRYFVCITQKHIEKVNIIRDLLKSLPFRFQEYTSNNETFFRIASKQLYLEIEKCGHLAPNKRIPDYIRNLTPELIRVFLDEYRLGDGYIHKGMKCYCTSSPLMADDLQEMILKSSNYASVSCRKMKGQRVYIQDHWANRTSDQYNVYEWRKPTDLHLFTRQIEKIPYNGVVYDVEVLPYHLIYVRRNGKCMWSGNSGVYDRLREQKCLINGVIAGGEPMDKDHYVNSRAEMYDNLRKRFEAGTISIPDDQDLVAQLSSIRFKVASDKKLQIISKEDMKRTYHLKSPDKADALALAFYEPEVKNPSIRWL